MNQPQLSASQVPIGTCEAVRFSLTSEDELPQGLVLHTISCFTEAFGTPTVEHPRVEGLHSLSLLGSLPAERIDAFPTVAAELRGPALALGVDTALTTGALAQDGPRLIVTDVDSTFIQGEVIEMLAAHAGSEELVRSVTNAAMRGEIDFAESLGRRVQTLAGLETSVVDAVATNVAVTHGAHQVVEAIHAHGGHFGLVSGGFHEVVDTLATAAGADFVLANRLETSQGKLTGQTLGPIIDRESKRDALKEWARRCGVDLRQTIAVGDGANDLAMMESAGLSVAFCAKPAVLAAADAAITTARLDKLVALIGWDC